MIKKCAYFIYLLCATGLIAIACYIEKYLRYVMNTTFNGSYRWFIYLLFLIIGIVLSMQFDLSRNNNVKVSSVMNIIFAIINLILFSYFTQIVSGAVVFMYLAFSGMLIYQTLSNIIKYIKIKRT